MQNVNGGFESADEWYAALVELAEKHLLSHLVRDRVAWVEGWAYQTPAQAFYAEYPEYWEG